MRKILLTLTALVAGAMSAWAQPAVSQAPADGEWAEGTVWFTIKNGKDHYFNLKYADASGNMYLNNTTASFEDEALWCVVGDETNGYKLYNKAGGTDMVLGMTGSEANGRATLVAEGTAYYVTTFDFVQSKKTGATYWCMKDHGSSNNYMNERAPYLAYWSSDNAVNNGDNGSALLFTEVDLSVLAAIAYTFTDMAGNTYAGSYQGKPGESEPYLTGVYTLSNKVWNEGTLTADITFPFEVSSASVTNAVMITNGASWGGDPKKWHAVSNGGTNYVKIQTAASNLDGIGNWLWAIYPALNDGKFTFTIKNIATGTYVYANPESEADVTGSNKPVSLAATGTAFTYEHRTGRYYNFAYNNTDGTRLVLSINGSSDTDKFLGVYGGNHNGNDIGFPSVVDNTVFPFPVSSEEVTNKTMIANYYETQRWHAVNGTDVKVQTATPSLAAIDEWMWAIYPILKNGAFTFKVKNIATGKFVTANKTTSSFNTQGTVTLTEEGTSLEVITWLGSPCFKLPDYTVYLTINSDADKDVYLATWTGGNNNHSGNKLHFPTISAYTLNIGSAKAATLTTPIAVSLPEGVTAGYVSGVNTEKQTLEYTDVTTIPAGESVVLFGEAGTYTFNTTGAAATFENDNYLVGYSEATDIPEGETVYALGNKNDVVAFYRFTGTQYAAGKAYLQLPGAAEAAMFSLGRGEEGTTGIENSKLTIENSAVIYDLAGRRVEKMEKGIYIVNGKKVVIK